jgi:hypothetical protein
MSAISDAGSGSAAVLAPLALSQERKREQAVMRVHQNLMLWTVALACCGTSGAAQVEQQESGTVQKPDYLAEMRQRADSVAVITRDVDEVHRQPLQVTPLFRYSDPRRDIVDAALWGYGTQGRPAALMKTESYDVNGRQHWVYCIATLSDELIEAKWNDGERFDAREPGLQMRAIPRGPKPGNSAGARLLQIRRLTGRFSATIQNALDNRDQMRLMPTPICRYADEPAGLIDGAVFGYTMGTNPDVLLVIELHRREDGGSEWRCGAAGMTSAGFVVRMDETEIMNQPFDPNNSGRPQAYARWMWRRAILPGTEGGASSQPADGPRSNP